MKGGTAALLLLATACASPRIERVIEPPDSTGDSAFVISREKRGRVLGPGPGDVPTHTGEKWYPFRAGFLGMREEEVRTRDLAISVSAAPDAFWDEQLAVEAVSIWTALCNECHGGRRQPKDALEMTAPPAGWGTGDGLFFGAKRPYREIFAIISAGGPVRNGKASEMPSWQEKLSHEQIWALIYFLEVQSGGKEGRFPPSLYPRARGEGAP